MKLKILFSVTIILMAVQLQSSEQTPSLQDLSAIASQDDLKAIFKAVDEAIPYIPMSQVDDQSCDEKQDGQSGTTTVSTNAALKNNKTSSETPTSKDTNKSPLIKSTIMTKAWFGACALGGKSRRTIFEELYEQGILEADLHVQQKNAGDRLRDAMEERYKYRDVTSSDNQSKIYTIFEKAKKLSTKTDKPYQLDQGLAASYNPIQQQALEAIIFKHALEIQPQLKAEKDAAIAAARKKYEEAMNELTMIASQAAANKRTLTAQSNCTETSPHEDSKHFANAKTYAKYLETLRPTQDSIPS